MADLKYINAKGEYVKEDAADSAYLVNPTDPDAEAFVQRIKDAAAKPVAAEPVEEPQNVLKSGAGTLIGKGK